MRIERLTPEQIARFPEFVEKWTKIGLCTDPADRPRAEAAINESYRRAGLQLPRKIVWCGSPLTQGLTRAIILDKKLLDDPGDSVWAAVWDSVWNSVRAAVWDSVRDSVGDSIYGSHDAGWLAVYRYFYEVCGLTVQTEKLVGLWELAQSAGWALPHANICWVSERHNILERDDHGRLHNLAGPACAYPDGWAIYAAHGVRVPSDVIERPDKLTGHRVLQESNAEVRRVMIDQIGHERFLSEVRAAPIHQDAFGKLYRIELPNDEPLVMVEVVNGTVEPDGTIRRFFLRVHPELRPMLADGKLGAAQVATARAAVASTYGKTAEQYLPFIRT